MKKSFPLYQNILVIKIHTAFKKIYCKQLKKKKMYIWFLELTFWTALIDMAVY